MDEQSLADELRDLANLDRWDADYLQEKLRETADALDATVALATEVAKEYEDAADWKDAIGKLQRLARAALEKAK